MLSSLSPTRAAAYTMPVPLSTASADAGPAVPYGLHSPALAFPAAVYISIIEPGSDTSTASTGPSLAVETYALFLSGSRARSDITPLVAFCPAPSPCTSSIVPSTPCEPASIAVRFISPSPFHARPSHPRELSPMPHMWATYTVPPATSTPDMREFVPLKRMSPSISPVPPSYMRRCE